MRGTRKAHKRMLGVKRLKRPADHTDNSMRRASELVREGAKRYDTVKGQLWRPITTGRPYTDHNGDPAVTIRKHTTKAVSRIKKIIPHVPGSLLLHESDGGACTRNMLYW